MRLLPTALLLCWLAVCAPVYAGTASVQHGAETPYKGAPYRITTLSYVAAAGERNNVTILARPSELIVEDPAGVQPASGCVAASTTAVVCDSGMFAGAVLRLGDGDDRLAPVADAYAGTFGSGVSADGGDGDDVLNGTRLQGGAGDDELHGSTVDGGPGADLLNGSIVTYAGRSEPIHADVEGDADDGAQGEGDRITRRARSLIGGNGADVLVGGPGDDELFGRHGDDRISGGDGDDRLVGGLGADVVTGGAGKDSLAAGTVYLDHDDPHVIDPASSTLDGGPGRDYLEGGGGPDTLLPGDGPDLVVGGGGADTVQARDGAPDRITCATGEEPRLGTAQIDAQDLARGCATVARRGIGSPRILLLGLADIDRNGLLRVGIGCSQDQRGGCGGTLRLVRGGRTLDRRPLRIAAGSAKLYRLAFPQRYVAARRSCPRRIRLTVVLDSRDTRGGRRTIRRSAGVGSLSLACRTPSVLLIGPEAGW